MMTDDEIIAVVRAHKEGKKIQWRDADYSFAKTNTWEDVPEGAIMPWNFLDNDYRVAPEPLKPREWNVIVNDEGNINWGFKYNPRFCGGVRVREVIEGASSGNPTVASDTASSNQ